MGPGQPAQRRLPVWRLSLLIVGVSCLVSGVATLRNDPDWSGWLAGAVGLGLLAWLADADQRWVEGRQRAHAPPSVPERPTQGQGRSQA
ncbi:hypothetical protein DQ239_01285 [Blastococcus sp. TF02-09]|nr:hypothetical protein DQ239_01285 [Blastococcus sp. TF02-9]